MYTNLGRIKPFVHSLVGGIHLTISESGAPSISQHGYTIMAGGGVDAKVSRAIAIRLVQADWLYFSFSSTTVEPALSHSNNVRISTGAVVRF